MSMLVRKGTMLHRTSSSRRNSRRNSSISRTGVGSASERRQRAASLVPSSASPSPSVGSSPRGSRASVTGPLPGPSSSTNLMTVPYGDPESRRPSNSASQISTDDRKKLYDPLEVDREAAGPSYGSIVYQMQDASQEASGVIDFVCRALTILGTTVFVTILLACLTTLPLLMVIIGVQYVRDCPKEPKIPIYLLVGGCFGMLKMVIALWRQSRSRRYERLDEAFTDGEMDELATATSIRFLDTVLTVFLLIWFGFGNYWVVSIYKPRFEPLLHEPNNWCHKTVYLFSLVQLGICYTVFAFLLLLIFFLACYRIWDCHFGGPVDHGRDNRGFSRRIYQ